MMTQKAAVNQITRARIGRGADREALLREIVFGSGYLGIAFLLGGFQLPFSILPLGLALLCASSAHSWYILSGLILSAVTIRREYPMWILISVYAACILLRIGALYFIDSGKANDTEERRDRRDKMSIRRDTRYLGRCWSAFKGFFSGGQKMNVDEIREDYYPGSMFAKDPPAPRDRNEDVEEKPLLFCENIFLRMLTGTVCAFALGLAGLIRGEFQVYDLIGTLLLLILTPIAIFLFAPAFSREGERILFALKSSPHDKDGTAVRFTAFATISSGLLLFLTVFAARKYSIGLGIPLLTVHIAPILALVTVLVFSSRLGFFAGIISAVAAGLAAEPMLTPILILASAIYTLLSPIGYRLSAIISTLAASVFVYFYGGIDQLILLVPSIILSVPIFLLSEKIADRLPTAEPTPEEMNDFTAAVTYEIRAAANKARMESLAAALTSLSYLFYNLSDKLKKPRAADVENLCRHALEGKCELCPRRSECNMAEDFVSELRLCLESRSGIYELPIYIQDNCPSASELSGEVRRDYAEMFKNLHTSEKTKVYAEDYSAISMLLLDAMKDDEEHLRPNREAADRIYDYLSELGIRVSGVAVCGKRICHVVIRGSRFERFSGKAKDICCELEKICGTKLSAPTFEEDGDSMLMRLHSVPSIDTVYSGSTVSSSEPDRGVLYRPLSNETQSKQGYRPPDECGDHIAIFKTNEEDSGYFYALISDGMGSGEAASFTSGICTVFLEKMLSAGSGTEAALRMLNGIIRSKNDSLGDECSATVDLLELDLISGHAIFAKNGAAPTYVVRGGTVYKLCARTVPVGILNDTVPRLLRFRMRPGDVIVMVSDGVTLGNDECPWLIDLLSDTLPDSMDSLRLDILRRAIASGSDDDLSAIAVKVEDAKEEKE